MANSGATQPANRIVAQLGVMCLLALGALAFFRYLTPFVIAVLLAIIIDPLVEWLARHGMPRGLSALLVLSAVAVLLLGLLVGGVARLAIEVNHLLESLPDYQLEIERLTTEGLDRFAELYSRLPAPLISAMQADQKRLYDGLAGFFRGLLGVIRGAPNAVLTCFLTVLATFFISRDKRLIISTLNSWTPRSWRQKMASLRRDMGAALAGFLRAQVLLVSLTAFLAVIGLLAVKVPYAWMLGLLAGFLDLIPLVGPTGVLGPVALYYAIAGETASAIGVVIVLAVILVVRQIVEPKVLGMQIGLHPLVTLVAIYLGFRFFGAAGFFVGPITAIFLKAVLGLTVRPLLREE